MTGPLDRTGPPPSTAGPLPGLPNRGRTYAFMAGVVATTLTLAVVLPLALGNRTSDTVTANDTIAFSSSAPGAPAIGPVTGQPLPSSPDAPGQPLPSAAPGQPLDQPAPASTLAPGAPGAPGTVGSPGQPQPGPAQPDGAGGSTGGGAGSPRTRTASDQGITADTVKVGFFLIDFGKANDLGASVAGYDPATQERYARAFVDEANATGGIGGRRLVPVFRKVDILSLQSMRDACVSFGQTDRVFAVGQVLGVYGDPILVCAQQQKLPFLANDGAASSYYSQSRNYVITTQPSTLRTNLNMVRELARLGELKGKKVGVVYYDGYLLSDNQKMLGELRRNNVDVVEGQLSLETAQALRQLPVIARDFCDKGVDLVLLGTNKLFAERFVQNVDQNPGCALTYAVSDFDFAMAGDSFISGMPASFFRRALSVTASRVGEGRVGIAEQPAAARCRGIADKRAGTRLDRNSATNTNYFNATAICQIVQLLRDGMVRAGTNPTRESFVQAVQGLGAFENAGYGPSSFRPGRSDSTDAVRISQAFGDCKCWKPQTAFAGAAFR